MRETAVGTQLAPPDSRVSFNSTELDEILHQKLEKAIYKQVSAGSPQEIIHIVSSHSPIDLAYAVSHLPLTFRPLIFAYIPDREAKIQFVLSTDSTTRLSVFRYMNDQELKQLFEKMPTDEAVRVSEDMSERRFNRLMGLLEASAAIGIRKQKQHRRDSAGRLMTPDFFSFPMTTTMEEVSRAVRDNPKIDFTLGVFVLNDAGELVGYVSSRSLLIGSPQRTLNEVMRPLIHKVLPEATRAEVVEIVERYKISFLPVVDERNHIVGVIAPEDALEAMEDLADAALANMAGTPEKILSADPIFFRFLARSPWLAVTIFMGLLNVFVISFFQRNEGMFFTITFFFVPLIAGLSGNIGIQCSTVLVRTMALGNLPLTAKKDAFCKELSLGLFSGVVFGLVCGVAIGAIAAVFPTVLGGVSPVALGSVIGIGLSGSCCSGTLLGVSLPLFFSRVGVDPAIASGPIVAAFNDFFSMSIYFLISWGLGSFFLGNF